jgi:hypothetical protein
MIVVAYHKLAACHIGQELFLCDLSVLSMTFNKVFLLFLVDIFHLLYAPLSDVSHDFLLLVITKNIFIFVFAVLGMMPMKQVTLR